ncbi:hypothetical protein [Furfurilactobacillus milii]|uniref:Uncharacterized protein n=2 Tax=Furfurilactobacillus rossiae TaxID=231049 RepID=A0A7C9IVH6_9LACO|nr:hypothetical protein [Furfurilactobacillus milii]MYV06261.1 hypothetical protein [Furfurilactobacillus milii]
MLMKVLNFITTFAVAIYGIWIIIAAQRKKTRPSREYQLWLLVGGIFILCQVLFSDNRLLGAALLFVGCVVVSTVYYLIDRKQHDTINWRSHVLRGLLELVLVVWAAFVG